MCALQLDAKHLSAAKVLGVESGRSLSASERDHLYLEGYLTDVADTGVLRFALAKIAHLRSESEFSPQLEWHKLEALNDFARALSAARAAIAEADPDVQAFLSKYPRPARRRGPRRKRWADGGAAERAASELASRLARVHDWSLTDAVEFLLSGRQPRVQVVCISQHHPRQGGRPKLTISVDLDVTPPEMARIYFLARAEFADRLAAKGVQPQRDRFKRPTQARLKAASFFATIPEPKLTWKMAHDYFEREYRREASGPPAFRTARAYRVAVVAVYRRYGAPDPKDGDFDLGPPRRLPTKPTSAE